MLEFIVVGTGGFIGSCLRFALTKLLKPYGLIFPMATLLSNVIAGFAIGFIVGWEQQSAAVSPNLKLFLTTGLLGGLSTFSTFSMETVTLFGEKKYWLTAGNILLNLGLGLLGVAFGMAAAKAVLKKV